MIATRDQSHLKNLGSGDPVPAANLWNTDYMIQELETQCPQLQIRFDVRGITSRYTAPRRQFKEARYQNGTFRAMITGVLKKEETGSQSINGSHPAAISFGDTFLAWDYAKSGELTTIRKELFEIITYNQTLLDVSSAILKAPQLLQGFIGIHFRAESDWPNSFGKANDQMRLYLNEMEALPRKHRKDLRDIYVSCGDQAGIETFRERVEPYGYKVHDKTSLLSSDPATLARMENLMFDERAIIEYQMLLNADIFLGPAMSTMSSLIAFARSNDQPEDFFPKYIFPGSEKDVGHDGWGMRRTYADQMMPIMRGDEITKLMVVNGDDVMDFFP